ncbi:PAS domain-containing protein [uncultured Cohaesibacter sp.]|uniref:PAS domain-containing protein n=1 Tax=uncultured Cohaesibacter sp. TaxID=1002546 RepID=UPI00292F981C|nr:PAS domain-containing protein [uncultured Cohaesibacter sp.]
MKHQVTRDLFTYWEGLRGGRTAPERSDIDPAEIHQILGDTFILEYFSESDLKFRLAGTRLCGSFCRELKGRNFYDLWHKDDLASLKLLLTAVAEDEAAAVIGFKGKTERDQELDFEAILLPLRHYGQPKSRILGAASPADMPYWIGIWPVRELTVSSMRLIWPDERPAFLRNQKLAPGPQKKFSLAPTTAVASRGINNSAFSTERRIGHLTVIEGGRQD